MFWPLMNTSQLSQVGKRLIALDVKYHRYLCGTRHAHAPGAVTLLARRGVLTARFVKIQLKELAKGLSEPADRTIDILKFVQAE